jgi:hypothetical protein
MAIGALFGEPHSFVYDLESVFWLLLWICVHHNGPDESRIVPYFDGWNFHNREPLPWINKLQKLVFPNGGRWEKEDPALHSQMRDIIMEAARIQLWCERSGGSLDGPVNQDPEIESRRPIVVRGEGNQREKGNRRPIFLCAGTCPWRGCVNLSCV